MSWASRRRTSYLAGVTAFFVIVIGVPALIYFYQPPTCNDGKQNQGETAIDKGGPCPIADENTLAPNAVLWSRAFKVRDGVYSALAYIENPNAKVGVLDAPYIFRLYDSRNILVADRAGVAHIMPGDITPIFEGDISTGNRDVARAFFEFTQPLVWENLQNPVRDIIVHDITSSSIDTAPRISAVVRNDAVRNVSGLELVATVFDTQGNAFASSQTVVETLPAGVEKTITFTWPEPFTRQISKIDVLPILPPTR